jgi:hypothetical protein
MTLIHINTKLCEFRCFSPKHVICILKLLLLIFRITYLFISLYIEKKGEGSFEGLWKGRPRIDSFPWEALSIVSWWQYPDRSKLNQRVQQWLTTVLRHFAGHENRIVLPRFPSLPHYFYTYKKKDSLSRVGLTFHVFN